jgi:hypothetical protein
LDCHESHLTFVRSSCLNGFNVLPSFHPQSAERAEGGNDVAISASIARWIVIALFAFLAALSLATVTLAQPAQAAERPLQVVLAQESDDDDDDDGGNDDDGGARGGAGRQIPRGGVDTGAGGTAAAGVSALPYALTGGGVVLAGLAAALRRRSRSGDEG